MKHLYFEPYVYIIQKGNTCLFYDTLSKVHFSTSNLFISNIISRMLKNMESQYCTPIMENETKSIYFQEFVMKVKELYFGDIYEGISGKLPIAFAPIPNFYHHNLDADENANVHTIQQLKLLNEIRIYVNGECKSDCQICNYSYKQVGCCNKDISQKPMDISQIKGILKKIEHSSVKRIIFSGGDILSYEYLDEIIDLYPEFSNRFVFEFHIRNLNCQFSKLEKFHNRNVQIIVSEITIQLDSLNQLIKYLEKNRLTSEIVYHIQSMDEIALIPQETKNINTIIKPIFNGDNIELFENQVYLALSDVLEIEHSLRDIHSKQFINLNAFGDLVISSSNEVFASDHKTTLGNLNNCSISEIIENALKNNWSKTRIEAPCCDCVYQWLCPSPSDYELAIGKPNLCHIKP